MCASRINRPERKQPCQARQYSDQMLCGRCDLAWDVNDHQPPECRAHLRDDPDQAQRFFARLADGAR
jgi:hypothetical protein